MFEPELSELPKEKRWQDHQEMVQCQRQLNVQMQDLRCEISRDTVSSVIEDLARHARDVTDYLITNMGLT